MLKNNIVIKINDVIVDYDDQTAIGITYRSYSPSEIDKIFLNSTNQFTLPKTKTNDTVFDFARFANSNPVGVYDKMVCYIYLNGMKILNGHCYLKEVANNRYSVQFIEGKNVFDKLKELPFVKLVGTDPNENYNSLMKLFSDYWNDTVADEITDLYGAGTTYSEKLGNVIKYAMRLDSNGRPQSEITIPIVNNAFGERSIVQVSDDYIEDNENQFWNYDNNNYMDAMYDEPDPAMRGTIGVGCIISAKYPSGTLTDYQQQSSPYFPYAYFGDDHVPDDFKRGLALISPIWASVELLISLLQTYTGYTFDNLYNIISSSINGEKLFCRCNGVELYYKTNVKYYYTSYNRWEFASGGFDWHWDYETSVASVGDCIYSGDSLNEVSDEDLCKFNCLDWLKSLMQEFNISCYVEELTKTVHFEKFSSLQNKTPYTLRLISEDNKQFAIDNIKQKQIISYSDISDSGVYSSLLLTSQNKNIDEGGVSEKFIDINRRIFGTTNYSSYTTYNQTRTIGYNRRYPKVGNDELKGFVFAVPKYTAISGGRTTSRYCSNNFKNFTIMFDSYVGGAREETGPVKDPGHPVRSFTPQTLAPIANDQYINTLWQPTVGDRDNYDYFQLMINNPIVEEVKVKVDLKFLHEWTDLMKVRFENIPGMWYVQEIKEFNPRTDNELSLKIVKLY